MSLISPNDHEVNKMWSIRRWWSTRRSRGSPGTLSCSEEPLPNNHPPSTPCGSSHQSTKGRGSWEEGRRLTLHFLRLYVCTALQSVQPPSRRMAVSCDDSRKLVRRGLVDDLWSNDSEVNPPFSPLGCALGSSKHVANLKMRGCWPAGVLEHQP